MIGNPYDDKSWLPLHNVIFLSQHPRIHRCRPSCGTYLVGTWSFYTGFDRPKGYTNIRRTDQWGRCRGRGDDRAGAWLGTDEALLTRSASWCAAFLILCSSGPLDQREAKSNGDEYVDILDLLTVAGVSHSATLSVVPSFCSASFSMGGATLKSQRTAWGGKIKYKKLLSFPKDITLRSGFRLQILITSSIF